MKQRTTSERLPSGNAAARVVDGLVEAVRARRALGGRRRKLSQHVVRPSDRRQRRGIRSDDQILTQTALEAQARHAERLVLIIVAGVLSC